MDIYGEIFEGVRGKDDLRRAIGLAVSELRASMEKEESPAVMKAHMRNLDDLDAESLARAYALAEKRCTFWPSPGEIRELAGGSEERKALEALGWVFRYLDEHGADGRARSGGAVFGDDGTGRRVLLTGSAMVKAPQIPSSIAGALAALGRGSPRHGLLHVSQHPRVRGWEGDAAMKTAAQIERQWVRCYGNALRNEFCGGTNE